MSSPLESRASMSLQERDFALLRGLLESRVMGAGHVADIYFEGRKEAAKKRLQVLKRAGLVRERPRRAFEPSALLLARPGLVLLRERGVLADYPSSALPGLERRAQVSALTVHHELEVMDVKAAFHLAVRRLDPYSIIEFNTWPQLNQFATAGARREGGEVTVKPDGFIRIHEREADGGLSEHTFFLEVDRSSETLDTIVARVGSYLEYYRSGGFAARNGAPRSAYRDHPFRVLVVFKTVERRNNAAERLLQNNPPIFSLAYLSTIEEARDDPLKPVWIRPFDYREATAGSPYAQAQRRGQKGYQRQTARDVFVEQRLSKQSILSADNQG